MTLFSSSRIRLNGKATRSAEVVTTQTMFPIILEPRLTYDAVCTIVVLMLCLVVGGTISLRATTRSKNDSLTDGSESTDESDTKLECLEDEDEA